MIDRFDGDYAFLSNFYPSEITFMFTGDAFNAKLKADTVEHAFQAQKANNVFSALEILNASTPGEAKKLGRKVTLRSDWDAIKLEVMESLLRTKFKSVILFRMLKATGDQPLIEGNYWNDTYWGVCRGVGQNNLGKLLMKIRDEFDEA